MEKDLSKEDESEIVQLRESDPSKYSMRALGKQFGCSVWTISRILSRAAKTINPPALTKPNTREPKKETFGQFKSRISAIRSKKLREALYDTGEKGM